MSVRSAVPAAVLLAGLLLSAPGADAAKGFFAQQDLHLAPGTSQFGARGGFTSYFRIRNDHTVVQGFRVWATGLEDSLGLRLTTGATLWMSLNGEDVEEIAEMACAENGTAVWEVVVDARDPDKPELPLSAESVLKFNGGKIEIRVPDANLADVPVLKGTVGDFHWEEIRVTGRGRVATLRTAPPPGVVPDEAAAGFVRVWRRREHGVPEQGFAIFASGLTEDETYEVWIEDAGGTLVESGSLDATSDGLGYFSIDSRAGDDLPDGIDVTTVRDLSRRRVELRRSGFTDYSLAGLFPRMR